MSLKYRIEVKSSDLPVRFVVKLGYWSRLVFDNVKDATRCFEAVSKAVGLVKSSTFDLTKDGTTHQSSKECSEPFDGDVSIATENIGTRGEVLVAAIWEPYFQCDGVPKGDGTLCNCWKTCAAKPGTAEPEDGEWLQYVESGKIRHMCPACQTKELKVETVVVTKTTGC